MWNFEVHSTSLKRRYIAPLCSVACLLNLLILLGALVLPLYICWATRLWQREVVRWEQLGVTYKSAAVVQLQGLKGPAGGYRAPFTAMWTTSPAANDLLGADVLRGMLLKSSFQDVNRDGLGDELRLTVTAQLSDDETVHAATVIAFVDAKLANAASLSMDALVATSYASAVPGQTLVVEGDVTLAQRAALPRMGGGVFQPYLLAPLPTLSGAGSALEASPEGLLAAAAARNFSLRFSPAAPAVWVPDAAPPAAALGGALATQPRAFSVRLTARVPLGPVLVRPTIAEELKHGWVQYLSLLVVTGVVAWVLRTVLFGWLVVETVVLADAPRSLAKLHAS